MLVAKLGLPRGSAAVLFAVCVVTRIQTPLLVTCVFAIEAIVYANMHFGAWWVSWGVAVISLVMIMFLSSSYLPKRAAVRASAKSEFAW
jgi:hypothetical protein